MLNAIGLLEVRGLVVGIEAADAMLKSASVRLLRQTITNPALVSLVVEGDLAACRAALDAGAGVALRANALVSRREIGRPEADTAHLLTTLLAEQELSPVAPSFTSVPVEPAPVAELLALLTQHKQGVSASEVSAALEVSVELARDWLEQLRMAGKLRKRGSRYRRVGGGQS
ncbi:BMC domain-containing protein [Pseudomonas nitroreducens]|uniref:BMC domain-containing protein n=1 Tax=Pseudomonas nitroreducens TaxID=46680 RepID=UPI00209FCCD5|nr:BMC domain-containing protein [Pseudomonas nitroreducens]MCP1624686.1 ethanolamine utilization protein EutK [Pseudomonas nitroreducens]